MRPSAFVSSRRATPLLACATLLALGCSADASVFPGPAPGPDPAPAPPARASVGVVQYNVKGGQGGWTAAADTLDRQAAMLAAAIRDRHADVVALEQADEIAGVPGPLATDLLRARGLDGWSTVVSACNKDSTQLAYSPAWALVARAGNPLVDGTSPQRGWVPGGCSHGDGRPYNMVYLARRDDAAVRALFVVAHLPHGTATGTWDLAQFAADLHAVSGAEDLASVRVVMAGDMNELGGTGSPTAFSPLLAGAGTLRMSANEPTCCADSAFRFSFDRVVTNAPEILETAILEAAYPLDPEAPKNEEHKAIFVRVAL